MLGLISLPCLSLVTEPPLVCTGSGNLRIAAGALLLAPGTVLLEGGVGIDLRPVSSLPAMLVGEEGPSDDNDGDARADGFLGFGGAGFLTLDLVTSEVSRPKLSEASVWSGLRKTEAPFNRPVDPSHGGATSRRPRTELVFVGSRLTS